MNSGTEGDTFTLDLLASPAPTADIDVKVGVFQVSGDVLVSGEEGVRTVTIPSGQIFASFTVVTDDDSVDEQSGDVSVEVQPGSDYTIGFGGVSSVSFEVRDNDGPAASLDSATYEVDEGDAETLTVTIAPMRTEATTIGINCILGHTGTPTDSADYTCPTSATVPASMASATFMVQTTDDMVNEGDETFTVLLVRLPAEIDRGTHHEATVTVVDDDDTPSVNLSVSGAGAAAEGGSALTITATRSVTNTSGAALSIPIRVRAFGTTAASADYTVATSIDIANNAASGTTTFTVVDDAVIEPAETVVIELGTLPSGTIAGLDDEITITIADNDTPSVNLSVSGGGAASEGGGALAITATLGRANDTGSTLSIPIRVRMNGTTADATDYGVAGSIDIANNAASGTTTFTVVDDGVDEPAETVVIELGTLPAGTMAGLDDEITITIADNDDPLVNLSVSGRGRVSESGALTITATRSSANTSGAALSIPIRVRTAGTTADAADYTVASSIRIANNAASGTTTFTAVGDAMDEPAETVVIELGALPAGYGPGANKHLNILILDNDVGVSFSAESFSAEEGRPVTVTLNLNLPQITATAVTLTYAAGTAESGDYTEVPSVSIPPDTLTHSFTIPTVRDTDEDDDTFTVTISAVTGFPVVGSPSVATVTIAEIPPLTLLDLGGPRIHLDVLFSAGVRGSGRDWTLEEGTSIRLRFSNLTRNLHSQDLEVNYHVAGEIASGHVPVLRGADQDEPAQYRQVTLPANQRSVEVMLPTETSTKAEVDVELSVMLMAPTVPGTYTTNFKPLNFTVTDGSDGVAGVLYPLVTVEAWYASYGHGTEPRDERTEGDELQFSVRSQPAAQVPFTVWLKVEETGRGDYLAARQERVHTVRFTPGRSLRVLRVPTVDDDVDEHDGEVRVSLAQDAAGTVPATGPVDVATGEGRGGYRIPRAEKAVATRAVRDNEAGPKGIGSEGGTDSVTRGVDPALVAQVRGYAAETHEGQAHVDRWKRVLAAFGDDNGHTAMTAAEAQAFADRGWQRWVPVVAALEALEAVPVPRRQQVATLPAVTVSAGADVTEGGDAVFTVTADPAPAAELAVSKGDFGVASGTQTVAIPTTGSATLTLATADDGADEADGSVSVTVNAGDGYTVGDPASGTVAVRDDDAPLPAVTVSAGDAVAEGGDATFTVTASPAPASPLAVSVTVAAKGDFGIASGTQTVAIPTTGSATLTLATANDGDDEADGSVSVTVDAGDRRRVRDGRRRADARGHDLGRRRGGGGRRRRVHADGEPGAGGGAGGDGDGGDRGRLRRRRRQPHRDGSDGGQRHADAGNRERRRRRGGRLGERDGGRRRRTR